MGVWQIRWISEELCGLGGRDSVMKPTGPLGTGVAQTAALMGWCIEEATRWITICSLQAREGGSGRDEARRNRKRLGSCGGFLSGLLECAGMGCAPNV